MTTAKSKLKIHIRLPRLLAIALFAVVVCLGGVREAEAASWKNNPNACPMSDAVNFPGQNCTPQIMCGVTTGVVQCASSATVSAPVASITSATLYSAAYGGGYVLDCQSASDAAAPFCDNNGGAWCNRDATCFGGGNNRLTTCVGGKWQSQAAAFTCGACLATNLDCGGDTKCEVLINSTNYPTGAGNHYGTSCAAVDARCDTGLYDCDATGATVGNGCEATRTGACIGAGGFAGTWSCTANAGGTCSDGGSNYNCVCAAPKCDFWTGDLCSYLTSNPLLWGRQFGDGDLIRMGNTATSSVFVVHNDGSIEMATTTAPADVTGKLYNIDGDLYWSGMLLAAGATSTLGDLQSVTDLGKTTTNDIQFAGGTSTGRFVVQNRLGIGTDTPLVSLLQVGGGSHEASSFSARGIAGVFNIANFRDENGENVFKAAGSVAGNDLMLGFGDIDYSADGTSIKLDYSQDSINLSNSALRFYEQAQFGQYVGFKAPAALTVDTLYTLPSQDGGNGQVLSTDGSGILSWVSSTLSGAGDFWSLNGNTNATSGSVLAVGPLMNMTIGRPTDYESEMTFYAGNGTPGTDNPGGALSLNSGFGDGSGNGGNFYLTAGEGGNTTGAGGSMNINAGSASNDGEGGFLYMNAGSGSMNGNGGGVMFFAGSSGQNGLNGGAVTVKGGYSENGRGGYVNIVPGISPGGTDGNTIFGYDVDNVRRVGQVLIGTSTGYGFSGSLVIESNGARVADFITTDDPGGITIGSDSWGGEFGLSYNRSNRFMVGTRIGGGANYDYVDLADRTVSINSNGNLGTNRGLFGINNIDPSYALDVNSEDSWKPIASFNNVDSGFHLFSTTGTPEGAVFGYVGDIVVDPTSGMMFMKQSPAGQFTNTGWVAFATSTGSSSGGTLNSAYNFGGPAAGRAIFTVDGSTPVEIFNPGDDQWESPLLLTNGANGSGIAFQTMNQGGDTGGRMYFVDDTADPSNSTGGYMEYSNLTSAFEFGYNVAGARQSTFYIEANTMALNAPGTQGSGAFRIGRSNYNVPNLSLNGPGILRPVSFSVGTSTPEGKAYAPRGSIYHRIDGVGGTNILYAKSTNDSTTGWIPLLTASSTLVESDTLQTVTNRGKVTSNWIEFAGGTSTGQFIVNDRLGVGTNHPNYPYELVNDASIFSVWRDNTSDGVMMVNDNLGDEIGLADIRSDAIIAAVSKSDPNLFYYGNKILNVTQDTNSVGINTGSPSSMLHLQGGAVGDAVLTLDSVDGNGFGRSAGIVINSDNINGGDGAFIKLNNDGIQDAKLYSSPTGSGFDVIGNASFQIRTNGWDRLAVAGNGQILVATTTVLTDAKMVIDSHNAYNILDLFNDLDPRGMSLGSDRQGGEFGWTYDSGNRLLIATRTGNDGNDYDYVDLADHAVTINSNATNGSYLGQLGINNIDPQHPLDVVGGNSWNPIASFSSLSNGFRIYSTTGTPEGAVFGYMGDIAVSPSNGAAFIKQSGNGTRNGWVSFATGTGSAGAQNLQQVTDAGNITSNWIEFAGGTSTGNFKLDRPASPAEMIVRSGTDDAYFKLIGNAGATDLQMSSNDGLNWSALETSSNGSLNIIADGTNAIHAQALTGFVGIGTSAPDSLLHVYGRAQTAEMKVQSSDGQNAYLTLDFDRTGGGEGGINLLENGVRKGMISTGVGSYQYMAVGGDTNVALDLYAGAQLRMHVATSGNVGIGSVNPAYKLDIVGDARLSAELMLGSYAVLPATGKQAGALVYSTAASKPYFWDGSAWIGLATGTGVGAQNLQQVSDNGNTTNRALQFAGATSTSAIRPAVTNTTDLGTNNYKWRRLLATNVNASGTVMATVGIRSFGTLTVDGNTTLGNLATADTVTFTSRIASSLVPSVTNVNSLGSAALRWKDLFAQGNIYASGTIQSATSRVWGSATATNMYVTNGLYVNGVAVSSSVPTLHQVATKGNVTSKNIQFAGGTSTDQFIVDDRLGIGTSRPEARLDIDSGAHDVIAFFRSDKRPKGYAFGSQLYSTTEQGLYSMNFGESGSLLIGNEFGSAEIMKIGQNMAWGHQSSGNMGIGSASDTHRLLVVGKDVAGDNAFKVIGGTNGGYLSIYTPLADDRNTTIQWQRDLNFRTGGADRMVIDNAGNVGIGEAAPTNILHVNGGITIADVVPSTTTEALYNQGGDLYWNGSLISSVPGSDTLQSVTNRGATTTRWIQFAGGTSTASFRPDANNTIDLGTNNYKWRRLLATNVNASGTVMATTAMRSYGTLAVDGNTALGNLATADTVNFIARIASSFNPSVTNVNTLGTSALRWKDLFAQGNIYASGTIQTTGLRVWGSATTTNFAILGLVNSDVTPQTTNVYNLGTTAKRWLSLWATNADLANVTSTNLYASGVVSTTRLFVNGTEVTGSGVEADTFQTVTARGAITSQWIQFAGGTSTASFRPGVTNSTDLGSAAYQWRRLFATNVNASGTVIATTGLRSIGTLVVDGNTTLGNLATVDTVTFNSRIASTLTPSVTNSLGLGTSALRWKELYAQGNIYASGTIQTAGLRVWGSATTTNFAILGLVNSDVTPQITNTYNLGTTAKRWLSLWATNANLTNVTSTNLYASGVVSTTRLFVNGTEFTGLVAEADTFQSVTTRGATTTRWIQFAGGTSTASFRPDANNTIDLGTNNYKWRRLLATNVNASGTLMATIGLRSFGILTVDGNSTLGNLATADTVTFNSRIASSLNPSVTNVNTLGTSALRWKDLFAQGNFYASGTVQALSLRVWGSATTTNMFASGTVSTTKLYVNGVAITGSGSGGGTLQTVTDSGNVTNKAIQFAGATSTRSIVPNFTNTWSLGTSTRRWSDLWAVNVHIGSSTWDLAQGTDGSMTIGQNGGREKVRVQASGLKVNGQLHARGSTVTSLSNPADVYAQGDYLYVLNRGTNTLAIYSAIDPSNMSIRDTISTSINFPSHVIVRGARAYVVSASGLTMFDVSDPFNIVFEGNYAGFPNTYFDLVGNIAVAEEGDMVKTYDVSDPANVTFLGQSSGVLGTFDVVASPGWAYSVSGSDLTVSTIDISDPSNPLDTGLAGINSNNPIELVYSDGFVYSLGSDNLLESIDVSNPNFPVYIDSISTNLNNPSKIAVSGDAIYVTDNDGVVKFNTSNGYLSFVEKIALSPVGVPTNIDAIGSKIFVLASASNRMYSMETMDGDIEIESNAYIGNRLDVLGDATFAAQLVLGAYSPEESGLLPGAMVYDAASSTPRFWNGSTWEPLVSSVAAGSLTFQQVTDAGFVTTDRLQFGGATSTGNFDVIGNISNLITSTSPVTKVASVYTGTGAINVVVSGDYAYLANSVSGTISIVDITRPTAPYVVANVAAGAQPRGMAVSGDYLYTADYAGTSMMVFDISKKTAPFMVTSVTVGSQVMDIQISGHYIYVANYASNSVSVYDIANPKSPVFVTTIGALSGLRNLAISGDYLYGTSITNNATYVVDISNPYDPRVFGTSPSGGNQPGGIAVQGRYIYSANFASDNLGIVDAKNGSQPTLTTTIAVGDAPRDVYVAGRYAYVLNSGTSNTLQVIDISNPASPSSIKTISIGGMPICLEVSGRYAYIANMGTGSLDVVDVSGTEVSSLFASSAEVGNLQSSGNIVAQGNIFANSSLIVGSGGIMSHGSVSVYSSTTGAGAVAFSVDSASDTSIITAYSDGRVDLGRITADGLSLGKYRSSLLTTSEGFMPYTSFSGGIGTGKDNTLRLTEAGDLVNINSIQANTLSLSKVGTFSAKVDTAVGTNPIAVAVGDLNGDNKPDIVTANYSSTNISVLINNGNGTYAAAVNYTALGQAQTVNIGDVNGDKSPDLIVASYSNDSVVVFINNGNGTFKPFVPYASGLDPVDSAAGDLNGDGLLDYAAAAGGSNSISTNINNGDGTFALRVLHAVGASPYAVALGDVNGDGLLDMATANYMANTMSVFINTGNVTFAAHVDYPTGSIPEDVEIADLNGDRKPDIAVNNRTGNTVSVFINNGNGTFAAKVDYAVGTAPRRLSIADMNGDGKADLVTANQSTNNVSVLVNKGNGTFAAAVNSVAGTAPRSVAVSDVDGDGAMDIVAANYTTNNVSVLRNAATSMLYANSATGNVGIGTSTPNVALDVVSATTVAAFDRSSDGSVVHIRRSGVSVGTISVAAGTVSYNAFTGSHYAWTDEAIEAGEIVSMTDENRRQGNKNNSEIVYGITSATTANDPRVLGSYVGLLNPSDAPSAANPHLVNAVGNSDIWVADKGQNIATGDYLITSDVSGHAMKDVGAYGTSYIFARAAEPIDWTQVTTTVDFQSASGTQAVKHTRISVFFESFARLSASATMQPTIDGSQLQGNVVYGPEMPLSATTTAMTGDVTIAGHVELSKDSVGQALIMAGETRAHITFERAYVSLPVITVTPVGVRRVDYGVENVSLTGFDIAIDPVQYKDTLYNWQSFGNREGRVFVSNGTTLDMELTDMGTSKLEAQLNSIGSAPEAPVVAPETTPEVTPETTPETVPEVTPETVVEPVTEAAVEPEPVAEPAPVVVEPVEPQAETP